MVFDNFGSNQIAVDFLLVCMLFYNGLYHDSYLQTISNQHIERDRKGSKIHSAKILIYQHEFSIHNNETNMGQCNRKSTATTNFQDAFIKHNSSWYVFL